MVVIRHEHKVYYPKLDIRACLTISKLFNDITAPLYHYLLDTQVLLLSLSLQRYSLTDDELYELIDTVDDLYELILELYQESGVISLGEESNFVDETPQHTTEQSNDSNSVVTFESHITDLLEQCMSIGMTEQEFYNSTLSEVTRYVNAHRKQQEYQLQEKAYFDYQLGNLIGLSVARLMSKDAKYPEFEKAYPFLSNTEPKQVDEAWEMEVHHNKLLEWAEQLNRKYEETEDRVME